jgi:hypothetical protein
LYLHISPNPEIRQPGKEREEKARKGEGKGRKGKIEDVPEEEA